MGVTGTMRLALRFGLPLRGCWGTGFRGIPARRNCEPQKGLLYYQVP